MTEPPSMAEKADSISGVGAFVPELCEPPSLRCGPLPESGSNGPGASAVAAHVKRFFEVWMADEKFRDALAGPNPRGAAVARGLRIDPLDIRYLWDASFRETLASESYASFVAKAPAATRELLAWIDRSHNHREMLRADSQPLDPRFAAWRRRQMARSATIFRRAYDLYTPHIVFAIELGKGCSVGCWFCGVSAPKLDAQFCYTEPNRHLFAGVLEALLKHTGKRAGGLGFLYWATDPFDNPDFERFCLEFERILGRFPIVTTAQPHRDLARTRAFLKLAKSHGATKVRFSATTLRILDTLHRNFSPEELNDVDIIAINRGSILQPAASGRARSKAVPADGDSNGRIRTEDTSISCVSGFLINMVDQTVKLITPCESSDRWPLGYYVYDERRFTNGTDLDRQIEDLIATCMPVKVPSDNVIRFRPDLAYRGTDDGFVLEGSHGSSSMVDNPLLRDVGDSIALGRHSATDIARVFSRSYGLDEELPLGWIDQMFDLGLIDEEPKAQVAS